MLDTLSVIGEKINKTNITWGVGGSLLLSFHKLIDKPNDIDILVDEQNAAKLNNLLLNIAKANEVVPYEPFKTLYFSKISMDKVEIDIMGGFAIQHDEGIFKFPFDEHSVVAHKVINGVEIPLCSLEDWYILYWLIPGKQDKAVLIENHLKDSGVKHPTFLENALKQPLPSIVKDRVKNLLNYVR